LKLTGIALTAGLGSKRVQALPAHGLTITISTVSMHHCALNNPTQFLTNRIRLCRKLGADKAINIGCSEELVVCPQKHQEVEMWETPLRVLDRPDPA